MGRMYRSTLHAHAESMASLGRAYADLAGLHRAVADAMHREGRPGTAEGEFSEWIFQACELAAAAERLLTLEIDLARSFGVTWRTIAETLGISRQGAWKRFAGQARHKTRPSGMGSRRTLGER